METPPQPPDDPEDWSDEQWIEYLTLTADDRPPGRPLSPNDLADDDTSKTFSQRVAAAPGSAVLGAAMEGLSLALYGRVEKPSIVRKADGRDFDTGHDVDLDEESSVARVRRRADGTDPPE